GVPAREVMHRAVSWVMGPTPVETARKLIADALDDAETSQVERAYLLMYMSELDAMHADFDQAREHLAQAELLHVEFSQAFALVTVWPRAAATIELYAGAPAAAARILAAAAAKLDGDTHAGWFSTQAALGAAALAEAGRFDEA